MDKKVIGLVAIAAFVVIAVVALKFGSGGISGIGGDVTGTYVNKYEEKERLVLKDGTYQHFNRVGYKIDEGRYRARGSTIEFTDSFGFVKEGKIKGDEIIVRADTPLGKYEKEWVKIEKPAETKVPTKTEAPVTTKKVAYPETPGEVVKAYFDALKRTDPVGVERYLCKEILAKEGPVTKAKLEENPWRYLEIEEILKVDVVEKKAVVQLRAIYKNSSRKPELDLIEEDGLWKICYG